MKKAHGITLSFAVIANILITVGIFSYTSVSLATDLSIWITSIVFFCVFVLLEGDGGALSFLRGTTKESIATLVMVILIVSTIVVPSQWITGELSDLSFFLYLVVVCTVTIHYLRKDKELKEKEFKHTPTTILPQSSRR
jgi:hypothetical protein